MKDVFKTIVMLCLGLLAFSSCGDDDEPEKDDTSLSLSVTELNFEEKASEKQVSITTNESWEAVDYPYDWITVTPQSGTGSQTIKVYVENNTTAKSREASIKIKSESDAKVIKVTQKAATTQEDKDPGKDDSENNDNPSETEDDGVYKWKGEQSVDLGLSVKWATVNVGAISPEGLGSYYAWGETATKSVYDTIYFDENYVKYNDQNTVLEKEDDVAYQTLGGNWRMPSKEEWDELIEKCTWTWMMYNGVKGYKVKASNGNSIFIPVAGFRMFSELNYSTTQAWYWSNTLKENFGNKNAWYLDFSSYYIDMSSAARECGLTVRPVLAE